MNKNENYHAREIKTLSTITQITSPTKHNSTALNSEGFAMTNNIASRKGNQGDPYLQLPCLHEAEKPCKRNLSGAYLPLPR